MLNPSLIGGKLLIVGDFNFPAINWDNLSTPHLSKKCAPEVLAATQDAFLFQHVQSPRHTRSNQKPTLTNLIFSQDDQPITNMTTSAPLGKSHHKVLIFHNTVDNNSKDERPRYLYHRANYGSMKLELQRVHWYEVFYSSSCNECWGTFKEIIDNLISKFVPLLKETPKKSKSIWMNKPTLLKIKIKNRAYHRFLKTKDEHDYEMYAKHRNQSKQSKNACRKAVTNFEKSLPREVKSNPKAFFRYTKNKLNFQNVIPDLVDNGKILSDDNSKAKAFNMSFKSAFTEESDCLPDFNLNVKSSIEHVSFQADKIKKKLDN